MILFHSKFVIFVSLTCVLKIQVSQTQKIITVYFDCELLIWIYDVALESPHTRWLSTTFEQIWIYDVALESIPK